MHDRTSVELRRQDKVLAFMGLGRDTEIIPGADAASASAIGRVTEGGITRIS